MVGTRARRCYLLRCPLPLEGRLAQRAVWEGRPLLEVLRRRRVRGRRRALRRSWKSRHLPSVKRQQHRARPDTCRLRCRRRTHVPVSVVTALAVAVVDGT